MLLGHATENHAKRNTFDMPFSSGNSPSKPGCTTSTLQVSGEFEVFAEHLVSWQVALCESLQVISIYPSG
jgi:hypothetical protein